MNTHLIKFDLNALAAPKTIDDLIALAKEIRAEFAVIHSHMDGIISKATSHESSLA